MDARLSRRDALGKAFPVGQAGHDIFNQIDLIIKVHGTEVEVENFCPWEGNFFSSQKKESGITRRP
jgi:hypothetical protein